MPRLLAIRLCLALSVVAASLSPLRAAADEAPPSGAPPAETTGLPLPTSDENTAVNGLGLRGRALFVPSGLLSPFLAQAQSLNSGSAGFEFVHHKGGLDVVLSLDLGFYSPPDGNYLGAGKDPSKDGHYVHVDNLDLVSADISFIYTHDLGTYVAFMIGAGIGLGVITGDIWDMNTSSTCTSSNIGDTTKCYATSPDVNPATGKPIGDLVPGTANFQSQLDASQKALAKCLENPNADCRDTALHPYYHRYAERPSAIPVLNALIGFKFKIQRHFNLNLTGGFRDGFFIGLGPEVLF